MVPDESSGAKSTPGPWRIGNLESYDAYTGRPFRNVWAGDDDDPDRGPAIVVARCIDNDNCDEDARLIAASPTRDAILRRIVAMQDDGFDMRDYDGAQSGDWPRLLSDIKATLNDVGGTP